MRISDWSSDVCSSDLFLTIDFRHPDDARLAAMDAALRRAAEEIAAADRLELDLKQILQFEATHFDPDCVDAVRKAAERSGFGHMDIISGAGHDAVYMARVAPAGMLFVPCEDEIGRAQV